MKLGIANGQNTAPNLTPHQLRDDIRAIGPRSDVMLWSEFGEAVDHEVLRRTLTTHAHHGDTECPVSIRKSKFKAVYAETVKLTAGKAGVNPSRFAQVVVAEHIRRHKLPPFAFVATHWTNGAFSNPGQRDEEWRDLAWQNCWEGARDIVDDLLANGLSVLLGGDLNARRVPRFTRRHEWLPGSSGIDKAAAIEAPRGVKFTATDPCQVIPLNSKHDGKIWRVRLGRP